jgi:hypothetical protein
MREIIMSELQEWENGPEGELGVVFIEVKKGERYRKSCHASCYIAVSKIVAV